MKNSNSESVVTKVCELRKGAKNELNDFYGKPTEVFRAMREIAKNESSALRAILDELGVKPNKLGFDSFGKYTSHYFGKVVVYKPYSFRMNRKTHKAMKPCENKPAEYIAVLCSILSEKRKEAEKAEREAKKAEREAKKAEHAKLSKEEKKRLARDKKRAVLIAKIVASGKSESEAEFLAALLVA